MYYAGIAGNLTHSIGNPFERKVLTSHGLYPSQQVFYKPNMPKDSGFNSPEDAALAMRKLTAADVDINQVPDEGRCYAQCVEGKPNGNNKVGLPQPDENY